MKKLFFALSAVVLSSAAFAQVKSDDVAKITNEVIDFGKIPQGVPAVATFIVTNIGTKDLIIEQATPTCGCTIGDFTKEPIKPGKTGKITATFNAAGLGPIDKHMNVKFAGTDDTKSIGFKGEVLTAEEYAKLKGTTTAPAAAAPVATPIKATNKTTKTTKKVKATKPAKVAA